MSGDTSDARLNLVERLWEAVRGIDHDEAMVVVDALVALVDERIAAKPEVWRVVDGEMRRVVPGVPPQIAAMTARPTREGHLLDDLAEVHAALQPRPEEECVDAARRIVRERDEARAQKVPPSVELLAAQMEAATARAERDAARVDAEQAFKELEDAKLREQRRSSKHGDEMRALRARAESAETERQSAVAERDAAYARGQREMRERAAKCAEGATLLARDVLALAIHTLLLTPPAAEARDA